MADRNLAPTWVTTARFGVLTLNSGLAIYSSWGDLVSILFVSGSYATLLLLFRCLRDYERAPLSSPARERARRAVWPLTTLLTLTLGVENCDMALAIHKARNNLVAIHRIRIKAKAAVWVLPTLLTEMVGRLEGGVPLSSRRDVVISLVWLMATATVAFGFR